MMIPQTIKIFFRTLVRNRSLTAINLSGLALGFASCILISLFLFDELGYDQHHVNLKKIYRINTTFITEGSVDNIAIAASPLPEHLLQYHPEVEVCVRFDSKGMGVVVRTDSKIFHEGDAYAADSAAFTVFSYTFIHGDAATALVGLNKVVLTRTQAEKYFGTTDVLGKTLNIDKTDHVITGVIEDVPKNSDITFSMLMSMGKEPENPDWFDFSYYTFVMFKTEKLEEPDFISAFEKKLQAIADDHINAQMKKENVNVSASMHLAALDGLHFDTSQSYDTPKGNRNYVYIFASVAILILFIACINYINFSIVQSMEKSREVGIRKVVGSTFYQLVTRYIAQSLLLAVLALVLALAFVFILLPFFNDVVGRSFAMGDLLRADIVSAIIMILLITGVLAGSYPAFYGSSIKIVNALKGNVSSPGGKAIRKVSITVQFAVTLGLIISTVVIYQQMDHIRKYDLGFERDNVVALSLQKDSVQYDAARAFKEELLRNNHRVVNAALVGDGGMPGDLNDEQRGSITLKNGKGVEEVRMINMTYVDEDYFSVLGARLKTGRAYAKGSVFDLENSIVVNEAFVQALGWEDPLSNTINWGGKERRVIGVVGNIYYKSLYNPVQAQMFVPLQKRVVNVMVSLQPDAATDMDDLRSLWQKYFPDEPFTYRFLDDTLLKQYKQEQTVTKVATCFSILTIAISSLGMFGLSLLSAYQRRKEIGIRKIVGASFGNIASLFSKEYLVLLMLALVLISPVAWYIMDRWLTTFITHTSLNAFVFILAGAGFGVLALVAIILSVQRVIRVRCTELIQ